MPIQDFNLYIGKGYAGQLVDSGPRVAQSGTLVGADVGFGVATKRNDSVKRGISLGSDQIDSSFTTNVYAISHRELNHEAGTRPSTGEDFVYKATESVSLIRQGYLYIKLASGPATRGDALLVDEATGEFTQTAVAAPSTGTEYLATNVFADEDGTVGDIIKVRIDIK